MCNFYMKEDCAIFFGITKQTLSAFDQKASRAVGTELTCVPIGPQPYSTSAGQDEAERSAQTQSDAGWYWELRGGYVQGPSMPFLKQSLLIWNIVPPAHLDTVFLSLECSVRGREFVVRRIRVQISAP